MAADSVNLPPAQHVKVLDGQGWIGLLESMGSEVTIVNAARVSLGRRREAMDDQDVKLLKYLLDHRHTSPFEHVVFTFTVHCPLFVRSQWQRHRTWSYNEISRRYTEVDLELYVPPVVREQAASNRQASVDPVHVDQAAARQLIDAQNRAAVDVFNRLLEMGVCREQARGVLPQNLLTTFWATVDLHNLISFLELRDSAAAQWEIRQYAVAIKALIRPQFPHVAQALGW
jgi:thymidylate synthase (FAD)